MAPNISNGFIVSVLQDACYHWPVGKEDVKKQEKIAQSNISFCQKWSDFFVLCMR